MRYNLGLSLITGLIIGGLLGAIFYIVPVITLICGRVPAAALGYIFNQALYWGVIPGIAIGLFVGFNTNIITLPRGDFSRSISVWCCIICAILAFATQWEFLRHASIGRIILTALAAFAMFIACFFIGQTVSFIEIIREKRKEQ